MFDVRTWADSDKVIKLLILLARFDLAAYGYINVPIHWGIRSDGTGNGLVGYDTTWVRKQS